MKITKWMADSIVTVAIVLGALLFVVSTVSAIATLVLTHQNHQLGLSNNQLITNYLAEEGKLATAGAEQIKFAVYLAETDAAICANLHAMNPTGPTCPPLPSLKGVNTK